MHGGDRFQPHFKQTIHAGRITKQGRQNRLVPWADHWHVVRMILGRVIGSTHATIQQPFYNGRKLLVVEKRRADGTAGRDYVVAVDTVDAGVGDEVIVLDEGTGARQVLQSKDGPVRSTIVGIVDAVSEAAS